MAAGGPSHWGYLKAWIRKMSSSLSSGSNPPVSTTVTLRATEGPGSIEEDEKFLEAELEVEIELKLSLELEVEVEVEDVEVAGV